MLPGGRICIAVKLFFNTLHFILSVRPSLHSFSLSRCVQNPLFLSPSICPPLLIQSLSAGFLFFFAALAVIKPVPLQLFRLFFKLSSSLCASPPSSPVVVVRGAGTPPPAPSPEEQAERASRKSAHAASHELHEAQPLTRVSVHTAALFGLCGGCVYVCVCFGCVNRQTGPSGKALPLHMSPGVPYGSVARQTASLTACSTVNKDKLHLSTPATCS